VRIRDSREYDAEALTALMRAAKQSWGYPNEWMEAWERSLTITPGDISTMRLRVAEQAKGIAGFYALVGSGPRVHLEHLWICPEHMGKGIGRLLFADALVEAARLGAEIVAIESDPNAEPFYLRMGAVRVGEVQAPMDGAPNRVLPLLEIQVGRNELAVPPNSAG
jgi:GNAT superfamily N-acetyltransferase